MQIGVTGFEPAISATRMQRSDQAELRPRRVGMTGLEPAASASLTQRSGQTELHPRIAEPGISPPPSATSLPLRSVCRTVSPKTSRFICLRQRFDVFAPEGPAYEAGRAPRSFCKKASGETRTRNLPLTRRLHGQLCYESD